MRRYVLIQQCLPVSNDLRRRTFDARISHPPLLAQRTPVRVDVTPCSYVVRATQIQDACAPRYETIGGVHASIPQGALAYHPFTWHFVSDRRIRSPHGIDVILRTVRARRRIVTSRFGSRRSVA